MQKFYKFVLKEGAMLQKIVQVNSHNILEPEVI